MAERGGPRYKMVIMQWGPIPPSGGPNRERYLDHHGRSSLQVAADEYEEVLKLLGADAAMMPALDFDLVEQDEDARRAIQREKRAEWLKFVATIDQATLDAIEPHIKKSVSAAMDGLNYLEDHELRESAHAAIHRAAFVKRGLFGCPITYSADEEYWTDCPINISHLRMGVSAGLVSDFECSICGKLVEDCDHALEIDSANVKGLYRRGCAFIKLNNLDRAAADLKQAQELDPTNAGVKKELRALALQQKAAKEKEREMAARMFG